ncbi:uncharacterized protein J3D65DRAFT_412505 [Phyllosticta citribraziliensis]|uniref:F-box domain-containing protein n=1 Tax=Phyllosticta citribraziliensis TaxID=989973 RepID=A0ABR1LM81_9PEZI
MLRRKICRSRSNAAKNYSEQANLALLPAELLYTIEHFLDDYDALAARLTCRRLRAILTSDENPRKITDHFAKAYLRIRLVEDAIADENEGKTHPGLMQVCEGCVYFHAKDLFEEDPETKRRRCIGGSRVFQPCEHTSWDWFSFMKRSGDIDLCKDEECDVQIYKDRRVDGYIACCCSLEGRVVLELRARDGPRSLNFFSKFICGWLAESELKICSHLRVKDLDLESIASQVLDDDEYCIDGTCPQQHCEAEYRLRMNKSSSRLHYPRHLVIELDVYHRFLVGAMDGHE